jgi:hypothetical protein
MITGVRGSGGRRKLDLRTKMGICCPGGRSRSQEEATPFASAVSGVDDDEREEEWRAEPDGSGRCRCGT